MQTQGTKNLSDDTQNESNKAMSKNIFNENCNWKTL